MTKQTASGIIIICVTLIVFFWAYRLQKRVTHETIDGHEYFRLHGWYDDDIEHSENCWCKKK